MSPSDEIVKYFLKRPEVNTGTKITAQMIEKFRESTLNAMRKVLGVTVQSKKEIIQQEDPDIKDVPGQIVNVPSVCEECFQIIKDISDKYSTVYSMHNAAHCIMISADNKLIGRLRVSDTSKVRYDFTKYSDSGYKLFLLTSLSQIRDCL